MQNPADLDGDGRVSFREAVLLAAVATASFLGAGYLFTSLFGG